MIAAAEALRRLREGNRRFVAGAEYSLETGVVTSFDDEAVDSAGRPT